VNDVVIRTDSLGKVYRLGQYVGYRNLQESIIDGIAASFRRLRGFVGRNRSERENLDGEHIWALKDVSFEIRQGEVVGIIGRNGAGKTTLLRILSRITNPTEGYADIHGRVGSLLEVGTGFHPELTGRENVYLNGAVLGMKKKEIDRKFDEIVDFSGVEQFMETPIKRYSSGMNVRLAFAVAAHLEPEILLVDEVLAVGDVAFQQKCIGKMDGLSQEGRTILFVSHDMTRIAKLCPQCILLDKGGVSYQGETGQAITKYLQDANTDNRPELFFPPDEGKIMCMRSIRVLDDRGAPATILDGSKSFSIEIGYDVNEPVTGAHVAMNLSTTDDLTRIWHSRDVEEMSQPAVRESGSYVSTVEIPAGIINSGTYYARIGLAKPRAGLFDRGNTPRFEVVNSSLPDYLVSLAARDRGLLAVPLKWTRS